MTLMEAARAAYAIAKRHSEEVVLSREDRLALLLLSSQHMPDRYCVVCSAELPDGAETVNGGCRSCWDESCDAALEPRRGKR